MASYRGVGGVLNALKERFELRMQGDLDTVLTSPDVTILGSQDLTVNPQGNHLGLYLHRISVDPFGRNRYLQPTSSNTSPKAELAVNLHILLIAWTDAAESEGTLVSWGMQQIGSALDLDISHLALSDPRWGESESLQVIPEDMDTENLLRIWDGLPRDYMLSAPYLIKTMRLEPADEPTSGPPVRTVATPMGVNK